MSEMNPGNERTFTLNERVLFENLSARDLHTVEDIKGFVEDQNLLKVGLTVLSGPSDALDGICHEKHVPINIDSKTRDRLNAYLYNQAPRGQGFSAFIEEALDKVGARKIPEPSV